MVHKKAYFGFRLEFRLGVKDCSFDFQGYDGGAFCLNRESSGLFTY